MEILNTPEYWDSYYSRKLTESNFLRRIKALVKLILGERILDLGSSYVGYALWNNAYKKYIPRIENAKIIEIGSAPGKHLIKFHKMFGFTPYGVEFSRVGSDINRENFRINNIDPKNIIFTDFLSDEFQSKYKAYFDLVVSRGVIEHFVNPESVIEKHVSLLKKNGILIVSIPNLSGIYYFLASFLRRDILLKHNFGIMEEKIFCSLFKKDALNNIFCGRFGTFGCSISMLLYPLVMVINIFLRLLLRGKSIESVFSPLLLYIGTKK